jgi:hypothetical protein
MNNSGIRRPLLLKAERPSEEFDRKIFGLELVKRAFRISSEMQKIEDWTLWRGRSPPKRRNEHCTKKRNW